MGSGSGVSHTVYPTHTRAETSGGNSKLPLLRVSHMRLVLNRHYRRLGVRLAMAIFRRSNALWGSVAARAGIGSGSTRTPRPRLGMGRQVHPSCRGCWLTVGHEGGSPRLLESAFPSFRAIIKKKLREQTQKLFHEIKEL